MSFFNVCLIMSAGAAALCAAVLIVSSIITWFRGR